PLGPALGTRLDPEKADAFPNRDQRRVLPIVASEFGAKRELEVTLTPLGEHFSEGGSAIRVESDVGGSSATAGPAPIRVIPHVKRFGTELEFHPFRDRQSLEQTHIPVLESRLIDHVTNPLRVKREGRGLGEYRSSV